jgi:hypothetical protein
VSISTTMLEADGLEWDFLVAVIIIKILPFNNIIQ